MNAQKRLEITITIKPVVNNSQISSLDQPRVVIIPRKDGSTGVILLPSVPELLSSYTCNQAHSVLSKDFNFFWVVVLSRVPVIAPIHSPNSLESEGCGL